MSDRFDDWQPPKIEHGKLTQWNWVVFRPENFKLGRKVDIGAFTVIAAHYGVTLEDEVQIGGGCKVYSYSTIDDKQGPIVMKRGACLGANSVLLPGVTIGENSIVGALSLVTKDIPPNEVWGGVPARRLHSLEEYQKKLAERRAKRGK